MFFECWFNGWLFREVWRAICCLIILTILGPLFFIIGISLLVTAPLDHTRSDNIKMVNDVVKDWNGFNKAQFQDLKVYVDTDAPGFDSRSTLRQVRGGAREFEDTKGIDSYEAIKYENTNILWPGNTNIQYSLYYYVDPVDPNTTIATVKVTPNPQQFIFTQSEQDSSETHCTDQGGYYTAGDTTCTYTYVLSEICVKFSLGGTTWVPQTAPGSDIGCYYDSPLGGWSPLHYTATRPGAGYLSSDVLVRARSSADPFVEVQEVTEGSGDFGLTPAQRAASGLGLMIVGIIFMIPCLALIFCTVYYYKFRKGKH